METVSNAASAASKLIFGEKASEEPVSGKTGKGTVEEPYDQGNRLGGPTSPTSPTSPAHEELPNSTTNGSADAPSAKAEENKDENKKEGDMQEGEQKDEDKDQPPAETGVQAAIKANEEEKRKAEEALANRDPDDHSGEPMRMHTGNEVKSENKEEQKADTKEGEETKAGEGDKSTGSEGGDVDVTKPAEGKEVDQKGVQRSGTGSDEAKSDESKKESSKEKDANSSPAPSSKQGPDSVTGTPTKRSMSKRIKDKLHIGSSRSSSPGK